MNDPHVVSLTYCIQHSDSVDFEKASPLCVGREAFRITIDARKAKVEMIDHFASEEEARRLVDPYLRAWEFTANLYYPNDHFRFIYDVSEMIDVNPPRGVHQLIASTLRNTQQFHEASFHSSRGSWPEPPPALALSFDADAMRRRWVRYRQNGEPLLGAAYWALTILEAAPGTAAPSKRGGTKKRDDASAFFNIELKVLNTLGELVSTRGGDEEGRKAKARVARLSSAERKWVEAAFRAMVLRVAERDYHSGPPPRPLTMHDLPPLAP